MFRHTVLLAAAAFLGVVPASGAFAQSPIATADGETTGTRIEITELSRTSGETVTLKFRLTVDNGVEAAPYGLMEYNDLREVHLIDAAGKKKYLVIKDSDGKCVCSGGLTQQSMSGKSINLWARFPAPPAEVKEISVVFPHFIPTDAPIAD
ncbi:MAG: hypothetical protein ACT4SY_12620 [Hyphomicrobiales bacterium]